MEGFDLLVKWMAKHLPSLDLSGLVVDDVEKELISVHLTKATMENVMEETTDVAEGMKEATIVTPTDPVPNHYLLFFLSFLKKKKNYFLARQEQYFYLGSLFWATKQFF